MGFQVATRRVFGAGGFQVVKPTAVLGGGGGGPTIIVNDTFTGTDTTLLDAHTGETGATWTKTVTGTYTATAQIGANRLRGNGDFGQYYASGTPTTVGYDVLADIYAASTAGLVGVTGRKSADNFENYYMARYYSGTGKWELYEVTDSGTPSYVLLGDFAQALTATQTYALKLQIRDATKKLFVDGIERVSSATNVITAKGKGGVVTGTTGVSTGLHLDNFQVTDA